MAGERAQRTMWVIWAATLLLAALCVGVFAYGVVRDRRPTEAWIQVDLGHAADWTSEPFRVWGGGAHTLYLTSLNQRPPFGPIFRGELEVRVVDETGRPAFSQAYPRGSFRHVRPENVESTPLARLQIADLPHRVWRIEARVPRGDSSFVGVDSRVVLRRERADAGIGGLVNYVMIFPGVALTLMALGLAGVLAARGGSRLPLVLSAVLLLFAVLAVFSP